MEEEISVSSPRRKITSISVEKKPKSKRVSSCKGLGKPTTPREPCQEKQVRDWRAEVRQYAQLALIDYNNKHGTDLLLSKVLKSESHVFYPGYTVEFEKKRRKWIHINLEAKRQHADTSDKPPLLFAEQYIDFYRRPVLTRLLLLTPIDNLHGHSPWPCKIRIPFHQFRAGFDDVCPVKHTSSIQTRSMESAGVSKHTVYQGRLTKRQKQETSDLAEFALTDYNTKHGTKLEFVRAHRCHVFSCTGLSMDFNEKETIWKHMNFVAKRPKPEGKEGDDCNEELLLFAELYLGDDDKHVLATLSVVDPEDDDGVRCTYCPASILHPSFKSFN